MCNGGEIMNDFSNSIKKINDQLLAFINRYEIVDDKDPLSTSILKKLKKQINSFNSASNQYVIKLERQYVLFVDAFKCALKIHDAKQEKIIGRTNESIDVINEKYIEKVNNQNEEINSLKASTKKKTDQLLQDIDYYYMTSNMNYEVIKNEYQDNINRYDYQIANAKDTYKQSILRYNTKFEESKKVVLEDSKAILLDYDEGTDKLIKKLNEQIDNKSIELNQLFDKLTSIRNQMKERFRQESISLNNSIRILVDEKNKNIVNARTRYSKSQSASLVEKENKKQNYQIESQKILKDFVFSMTQLDSYASTYKEIYQNNVDKISRKYYYKLLEIHKTQNEEIKEIYNNGYSIQGESDKYTKHLVRNKNKHYYKESINLKKEFETELDEVENQYLRELEVIRHNKALLDIDKNYSIKAITEKEQSDNKHYQELNNIYENDMNLLIKTANQKYNQKANTVKCQSQIKNKILEKDLDISEANIQKKIESIQTDINKIKLDIAGALELKKLLHEYEDEKHNRKLNNLSVNALLEIEKCKMLDLYNTRQYNDNVYNSKMNLSYGNKKIDIENEKFETITKLEIKKLESILSRDIVNTAYKIREDQIYESEEKSIQSRNGQYELDSIHHTVLYERFTAEIKIMQQILSTFVSLVKELEAFQEKILLIFFSSIKIRPEYNELIKIFLKDFNTIIDEYFKNLVDNYRSLEVEIIYKRVDFEEKFKFKTNYNDLLENYENERKRLLTKKKSITDTIDNYSRTLETFKSRIYNLENQNVIIRQNKYQKHNRQKEDIIKEYHDNKKKIEDMKNKVRDISKLKGILDKDNLSLQNELKKNENEYTDRVKEIKKMQYNSAASYYDFRLDINKIADNIIEHFPSNDFYNEEEFNFYDYERELVKNKTLKNQYLTNIFKHLYDITSKFYTSTSESILKDKFLLLTNFNNDIKRITVHTTNEILNNRKEYDKKVAIHIQEIENIKQKLISENQRYDNLLKENDKEYQIKVSQILTKKKESLSVFYKDFYATCDNLEDINSTYNQNSNQLENDFKKTKEEISRKYSTEKNELDSKLHDIIRSKEDLINHLPSATKFQSQQMNRETREHNASISNEIKESNQKFAIERKNIQKNISSIHLNLEQVLEENEYFHQKDVIKEKRKNTFLLKHIKSTKNNAVID